jgi:hypothetical protein
MGDFFLSFFQNSICCANAINALKNCVCQLNEIPKSSAVDYLAIGILAQFTRLMTKFYAKVDKPAAARYKRKQAEQGNKCPKRERLSNGEKI